MQAVLWTKYGKPDVLHPTDVPTPVPKADEVLIKIHAATVTAGDCEMRGLNFGPFLALAIRLYAGAIRPTRIPILGQEMAGVVEAVGEEVTRFQPGDAVFGLTGLRGGGYAEYTCLPERAVLAPKPADVPFAEAATIPTAGMEALHFMNKARLRGGERMLIVGGGGSIGTYAIQLAKHFGAHVTGVDSTPKLALMRSLGADHVIDYTQDDYTQTSATYDVVFDVIGKSPFGPTVKLLTADGRYLIANPSLSKAVRGRWVTARSDRQVILETAEQGLADLITLTELIQSGIVKPFIDRRYPLAETAAAHRYAESGQKQGNIVINVVASDAPS